MQHLASEALRDSLLQVQDQQPPPPTTANYTQNMAAFQESYDQALARRERGEPPIPYLRENATGGLGAREGGRGFGVELEFDLHGLNAGEKQQALLAIGQDLQAAGLVPAPYQRRYHSTTDYTQWRFEEDYTVSGEIISPILYDEPETWEQLAVVCDIIARHGGKATVRTGSHIHVACDNYDHTPRNHSNLLHLFSRNEDVLYRLAQNPKRPHHRGQTYCEPNLMQRDYTSVTEVWTDHSTHSQGLNFSAVLGNTTDHVEYRLWDGNLDPAVIQSQIKLLKIGAK